MTREVLDKVVDGIAFDEMPVTQEVAVKSLIAELQRRMDAEKTAVENLERLNSLQVGDRLVFPPDVYSPEGQTLTLRATPGENLAMWWFDGRKMVLGHGAYTSALLKGAIRGGAVILRAEISQEIGE